MSNRARYRLVILGILLALTSLEGLLRLYFALAVEPRTRGLAKAINLPIVDVTVPDVRLGYRLNPLAPGVDARGWRNASALGQADIIVLGDSLTYGVNVSTEEAWPQSLGQMLHRRVYQMAVPGYGPGQYLLLLGEVLALRPKVVIAAYYLGNDIIDAYRFAYHVGDQKDTSRDPLTDALVSKDPKVRESVRRAEAIDPGLLRADYLDCHEHRPITDPHLQVVHNILSAPPLGPLAGKAPPVESSDRPPTDSSLSQSSVLYRVVRNALGRVWHRVRPSAAVGDYGSPICVHYRDGQMSTIFTPGYRLVALDRTDPRVVEGERIAWLAFEGLAQRCRRAGVRFYVAVLPTKEAVFRARAYAAYHNEPYLRDLWEAEADARSRALTFFSQHGIEAIDTLPAQEVVVASGVNPYRETSDGHPKKPGYAAIAGAVANRLNRDGVGGRP